MKPKANGVTTAPKAQWLGVGTREIPPLAFAIPQDEFLGILNGLRAPDEQRLRKIVESQLLARYGAVVRRLEANRDSCEPTVSYLEKQLGKVADHIDKNTPPIIPDGEPVVALPHGLKCAKLIGLVLLAFLLGVFDWVTAAGFAARAETHHLGTALFFTALVPLAPLAIKLALSRINRFGWSAGRAVELGLLISSIGLFLWKFVIAYASPDESLNQIANMFASDESLSDIANQLGGDGSLHSVDKRLLLFSQLVAGIVVGIALVSALPSLLVYSHRDIVNRNGVVADTERSKLATRLGVALRERADPVGNLAEWQHSIEALVASGLAYLELRARKLETTRARQAHFDQSLSELDAQLTTWTSPRISTNTRR